ncbi:MAG: DUF6249 domain-containing protein [Tannerella sp.]|jgi:hypothetical protein|nr:DUF6249 domain-containing protein [Tannerella sp.]
MQELVTIVVLVIPFVFVIVITWLKFYEKHKQNQLQAELYVKCLEKGQPIPSDLFPREPKPKTLNIGIILIAAGIGISLLLWLMSISLSSFIKEASTILFSLTPVGILPFLVGVAHVMIHFIEKKKDNGENAK